MLLRTKETSLCMPPRFSPQEIWGIPSVSLQESQIALHFLSFISLSAFNSAFNPPSMNTVMTIQSTEWDGEQWVQQPKFHLVSLLPPSYLLPIHLCTITQSHTYNVPLHWEFMSLSSHPHRPHPFTSRSELRVKVQLQWLTYPTTHLKCSYRNPPSDISLNYHQWILGFELI